MTLLEKAVEFFGITTSWWAAGYLLPDGCLLDFGRGQPHARFRFHDEVTKLGAASIDEFMLETKSGRLLVLPSVFHCNFTEAPTKAQVVALKVGIEVVKPEQTSLYVRGVPWRMS